MARSFILALAILTLLPTLCLAQDTSTSSSLTSTSSTRTTSSSTRTTSFTSSGSASASSSAIATKTYSIPTLPTTATLPPLNASSPLIQLVLPPSNLLYLTFSICTLTSNTTLLPNILISNEDPPSFDLGSRSVIDQSSGGTKVGGYNRRNNKNGNTWNVVMDRGFGNWTMNNTLGDMASVNVLFGLGLENDGETLDEIDVQGGVIVQMSASGDGPLNSISSSVPFLGDTTSSQALIFSPLLYASESIQPTYPNYTLPPAQLPLNPFPTDDLSPSSLIPGNTSLSNNLTLYIVPTNSDSSPTINGLEYSTCAISLAVNATGFLAEKAIVRSNDEPEWSNVDDQEGYRHYWAVGGLSAGTNYTTWIRDDRGVWAGPVWFTTKSESFPCQLVLPTSICPSIAYSAPLPVNSTSSSTPSGDLISDTSPIQSLPQELITLLTENLEGFSNSLLSQACGRDLYSHVSTCSDCFASYRDWLCRLVIPQCSDPNLSSSGDDSSSGVVHRPSSDNRNGISFPYDYDELLPCLSICNRVDRVCPVNMGFRCPRRAQNANESYAFIGEDTDSGDGSVEGGIRSYDVFGGRWCNG
ncbi:hypothetical protein I302_105135 [Kwoniella bestiolae CBS 10118]|uniref:Calcium channel n=1 Tax=Kwoniella bestiolae CBS 10118 TaxID=1296100 RepID=A0A1B9FS97_9TREE|nr:hypothetical protein I302_08423 [Kwoniella bestiolae CBS 10118]OCF21647.1 hypothetical protein I302_08423 [Kwoniella bestiolae CBS 10118]